jgi:choline dehydrogenase
VYALKPGFLDINPPAGALLWTASSEARDDELDLHLTATHLVDQSLSPTGAAIVLGTSVVAPDARGTLRLRSRDPRDQPEIDTNFLGERRDRTRMLEGAKLSRELSRSPQLAAVLEAELRPGAGVWDDATLAESIERRSSPMRTPPRPCQWVDRRIRGLSSIHAARSRASPACA